MATENFEIINGATPPPPVNQITLETWDRHAPQFLDEIKLLTNETATNLMQGKLDEFRSKLANPSSEASDDFAKLRQDCAAIIAEHVPDRHIPRWKNALTIFFQIFVAALAIALAISLALMFVSKVTAIMGIITIVSFNFKSTLMTALTISTVSGGVASLSLFAPKFLANHSLNKFDKVINPEANGTTPVATRIA